MTKILLSKLVKKINHSTSLRLKDLNKIIEGTCSLEEKIKAKNIFKIYFNRTEIVE